MLELDDTSLPDSLKGEKPILVDFNAQWCGPCKRLKPVLESISRKADAPIIASVDIDAAPESAVTYNVELVPTLVLFKGGKEIARRTGLANQTALEAWIAENVAK